MKKIGLLLKQISLTNLLIYLILIELIILGSCAIIPIKVEDSNHYVNPLESAIMDPNLLHSLVKFDMRQ